MDWEDLKSFVALTRCGTVRRAAIELGVHHATVARRISRLEDGVGVRLFDRKPEGLSLTAPGEDLMTVAKQAAEAFDAVQRRVSGQDATTEGCVTVSMGAPVATLLMAKGLPEFATAYPNLDLRIVTTWNIVDLSRGEADIAVRADNNPSDTLFGKRMFPYYESVFASRAYLEAFRNRDAADPGRWIGWGGAGVARPAWVEKSAFAATTVWGGMQNLSLQVAAAEAGLGFAALPCFVGDSSPDLRRADASAPHIGRDIWLLTHPDLRRTRRIQLVMAFLEAQLRTHRDLIEGRCPKTT